MRPKAIGVLQAKDPTLSSIKALSGKPAKETRSGSVKFVQRKGLLHRQFATDTATWSQLVVPKALRSVVLKLGHDSPMAGHLGAQRTLERIQQSFYWPGIASDVRKYCRTCDSCQRTTPKGRNSRVPLGTVPLVGTPFAKVGVDLIGPILPASSRGHKYVLVQVDYATRYPDAIPLKKMDAVTVAEALWEMWTRTGIPETVLTDQGTQFMSEVMSEVYKLLRIHRQTTTPYHAQANGLVERFNGTLKQMIKRLAQEQPKEWDRFIPGVLFAYREVPQESLGFSPFELLYGRTVKGPMAVLRDQWTRKDDEEEKAVTQVQYVLDLKERIAATCELAQQHLAHAQQRYKKYYDRKSRQRWYEPGEEVLLLLPLRSNKLELSWQGPFPIIKRVGDWDYVLLIKGKEKLVHANLLKRYERRETCQAGFTPMVIEEAEAEPSGINLPCVPTQQEETWEDVKIASELTPQERKQVLKICEEYQDILTDVPLRCNLGMCSLTLDQSDPVRVKQYPLPHSQTQIIKDEVRTMLEMGVIERSTSPFSSPILLVKKPDGKMRFCVDFRRLNRQLQFDAEPIPDVDRIFAQLSSAKHFTKLDLAKGYWQIPMAPEDREKTAFTTPEGQFQFVVMPFGLKTAGAVFSRIMRLVLEPLRLEDAHNFIDDLLIATKDWERHICVIRTIFARLREVQLAARPTKCRIGEREIGFLGHVVGRGYLLPEEDKMQRIEEASPPATKKGLRSFLGLVGYYRKFIPHFADIAKPLTDKTGARKPEKLIWSEEDQSAFQQLKEAITSRPILQLADASRPFVLRTDASGTGIGAVLLQDQGNGLLPVSYASKKLVAAEKNYHTIEQECFAVVWATRRFYPYLYGREFVLECDHHPLQYLHRIRPVSRRLMGWAMELQSLSFRFQHIPGRDNVEADYLSRME